MYKPEASGSDIQVAVTVEASNVRTEHGKETLAALRSLAGAPGNIERLQLIFVARKHAIIGPTAYAVRKVEEVRNNQQSRSSDVYAELGYASGSVTFVCDIADPEDQIKKDGLLERLKDKDNMDQKGRATVVARVWNKETAPLQGQAYMLPADTFHGYAPFCIYFFT